MVNIHRYQSKAMGKQRGLYVYLPAEYQDNFQKNYPALYLRHGGEIMSQAGPA